jgi:hypothetical protein
LSSSLPKQTPATSAASFFLNSAARSSADKVKDFSDISVDVWIGLSVRKATLVGNARYSGGLGFHLGDEIIHGLANFGKLASENFLAILKTANFLTQQGYHQLFCEKLYENVVLDDHDGGVRVGSLRIKFFADL